jgi:O-acetyl-ADP-ribose deacetylase (regulator of RNase III)
MITYKTGDIFTEQVDAIVNTVNCVGVMGRGIALQFKKRYPENFKFYQEACNRQEVVPGKMLVYETGSLVGPRYIINFPTKRHWRGASRIEDIESGLVDLNSVIKRLNIRSIAIPPLGSGLGGLNWNDVRSRIENALCDFLDLDIIVFEPGESPDASGMVRNRKVPDMTAGRAALVELVNRYLSGLLDPFITLLEVHKLMYFLQESGEPLKLKYQKHIYGPYAENLRHVLNTVEGHFLSGYADAGDRPDKELRLVPGATQLATEFLKKHEKTKLHFERVSELVEGFESPFGMELLSTVHWVVAKDEAKSKLQIVNKVHQWNDKKSKFTPRQIELAYDTLTSKGWLSDYHNTSLTD